MKSEVSVLLSAYNAERYIKKSIESVLAQSYKNFEFLIVDDGSKDRTWEIISRFRDKRIRCFKIDNLGVARAKNFLLKNAKGDWIAIIDADDIWHPLKLEIQLRYLRMHPECKMLGTFAQIIDDQGNKLHVEPKVTDWLTIQKVISKRNVFTHSSLVYDASIAERIGGYPVSMQKDYAEDYQMIKNFIKYGNAENLPVALVEYRIALQSITSSRRFNFITTSQKIRMANHYYILARIHAFYLNNKKEALKNILKSIQYEPGLPMYYIFIAMLMIPGIQLLIQKKIMKREHFEYLQHLESPEEFLQRLKVEETQHQYPESLT
ncbi:glycosyltransferase family 2 protein [Schleiferia thermophila]